MDIKYTGRDEQGSIQAPALSSHGCDLNISISVSDEGWHQITCVTDPFTKAGGRLPRATDTHISLGRHGISVETDGGRGVRGRNGVDGRPGADGHNGSDATTYSRGGDGGNGGPGEDGTPGTSGGPGGDGGNITLNVADADTDALALFSVSMSGGEGGPPGRHGQGGRGGRGGRGGNSYSWREPYQEMVTKTRQVSRYENGQTVYHTESYTDYETRYREHYQPGGSNGSNGRDGHTPTTPLYPGRRGEDGELTILVEGEDGIRRYSDFYKLQLQAFTSEALSRNGINEPGDTLEVSHIQIRNNGGMPTPRGGKLHIQIKERDWMEAEQMVIALPDPIQPGESVILPAALHLKINEYSGTQHEPYRKHEPLDLMARAWRYRWQIQSFTNERQVRVSHPIETTEVRYAGSLLQGEVTRLTLRVRNMSTRPLGGQSLQDELRRTIKMNIERQGVEGEPSAIVFCGADGTPVSRPAIGKEIRLIEAGQSVEVSTFVKLVTSTQERRSHPVHGKLFLERIAHPRNFKRIQTSDIEIKEGISYRYDPNAAILLVINQSTKQEEVAAWRAMATSLNLGLCVWDLGIHHQLPLNEQFSGESDATLNSQWSNKLIVVLNNGRGVHPTHAPQIFDQVSQPDLDRAIRDHNVRFYLVGSPYPSAERPSISPYPVESSGETYEGMWALKNAVAGQRRTNIEFVASIERVRFQNPSLDRAAYLRAREQSVRSYLSSKYPSERFYVSSTVGAEEAKKYWLLPLYRERVGTITVRREDGPSDGILVGAGMDGEAMRRAEFIRSDANKVLTLAAMPDGQLVGLLEVVLTRGSANVPSIDLMCRAFAYKIAVELGIARDHEQEWGLKESSCLNGLVEAIRASTSKERKPILSLCALLMSKTVCLGEVARPWHRRIFRWGREHQIATSISREVDRFERHLGSILSRAEMRYYREDLKENVRDLRKATGSMKLPQYLEHLLANCPDEQVDTRLRPWSANPYFSDSAVRPEDFRVHYREIESEVSRRIQEREELLVTPCTRGR